MRKLPVTDIVTICDKIYQEFWQLDTWHIFLLNNSTECPTDKSKAGFKASYEDHLRQKDLEATTGFEPVNSGFADRRLIHLATSPHSPLKAAYYVETKDLLLKHYYSMPKPRMMQESLRPPTPRDG